MSDHLVLFVDRLVRPVPVVEHPVQPAPEPSTPVDEAAAGPSGSASAAEDDSDDEDSLLLPLAECRICQEEDSVNNLETPCSCSGSLKVRTSIPIKY